MHGSVWSQIALETPQVQSLITPEMKWWTIRNMNAIVVMTLHLHLMRKCDDLHLQLWVMTCWKQEVEACIHQTFPLYSVYEKKKKIRNKSLVQLMQTITKLVNNLNKMEEIIEEHALRCQRLMATSNNLQQVLDSYIEYPKDSIPPNSYKCQR